MKSQKFFQNLPYYYKPLIALIFLLGYTSCHDDETVLSSFSAAATDVIDDYRGNFELMSDNCDSPKYTIEISRVTENLDEPIRDPFHVPKIYIANLINARSNLVLAEWDGSGFVVTNQDLMVDQTAVRVNARLLLSNEKELNVHYTILGAIETISCACTFRKE